ncbi:hypothetical protein [Rhabdothermincola salaria]|uniref:hypothetical protein n=1 Tax=Rhabdothermincola salaria TaxID=2903142 RepID=UPI001E3F4275|nr:hypothetical protein [Rhabdothermincola salaria]MCD9623724.1 hypothetical protein [Rhabdothermincola salaria]
MSSHHVARAALLALLASACSGTAASAPPPEPAVVSTSAGHEEDRTAQCVALIHLSHATAFPALGPEASSSAEQGELGEWLAGLRTQVPPGFADDLAAMEAAVTTQVEALALLHTAAASSGSWPSDAEVAGVLAEGTEAFEAAAAELGAWIDAECGPDVVGPADLLVPGA